MTDRLLPLASALDRILLSLSESGSQEALKLTKALYDRKDFEEAYALIDRKRLADYMSGILGMENTFTNYAEFVNVLETQILSMVRQTNLESADLILKIKNYVADHYKEDISISNVADVMNISQSYLSRVFHQRTGEKYIDYMTKVRMEAAMELLKSGESYTTKRLAEEVGYVSPKHFGILFQKYTGLTPSEYRKKVLEI